jgi:hypothetical protein
MILWISHALLIALSGFIAVLLMWSQKGISKILTPVRLSMTTRASLLAGMFLNLLSR